MKKNFVCAAALLALAGGAAAQGIEVRPLIGLGLTFGGDEIETVTYDTGNSGTTSETLHAGGLIHIYTGVDVRFTPMVSAQLNVGYHVDGTSGSNASLKFDRTPVELLGHFNITDRFRVGGGARFISGAKVKGTGFLNRPVIYFQSTTGSVVEAEYFFTRGLSVKGRYVSEKYKVDGFSGEVNGSHGGLYVAYYFL